MNKTSLSILGAGNIGQCIAEGLKNSGFNNIILTNKDLEIAAKLQGMGYLVRSNREAVQASKLILLAVKPKYADDLIAEILEDITEDHTIISVMSAVSQERLRQLSEGKTEKIIRIMTNTACRANQALSFISGMHREALETAYKLMNRLGTTLPIQENLMAEATIFTGSMPAAGYTFIQSMMEEYQKKSFSQEESLSMALQIMKGCIHVLESTGQNPTEAIQQIATKGGCTEDLLSTLETEGFQKAFSAAVNKGIEKAKILYQ